jgi:hypothetical protein
MRELGWDVVRVHLLDLMALGAESAVVPIGTGVEGDAGEGVKPLVVRCLRYPRLSNEQNALSHELPLLALTRLFK